MSLNNYENEQILIRRLKIGDENAYRHLYELYYADLCNYLHTICGNLDLSKEIAQEAFIKIWKKRDSLLVAFSLKKYIFKIAYNLFIDSQRKKKRNYLLIDQLKYESANEMTDISYDNLEVLLDLVNSEVDQLPSQCKRVFLLGKKEGLKYREIAEELNISIKTVERHMTKALKRLRKRLKDRSGSVFVIITFFKPNSFLKG
tara:strand:- start:4603 stop:5208 length:606 start_codon:yes stop_codon:yes gene_type:complete